MIVNWKDSQRIKYIPIKPMEKQKNIERSGATNIILFPGYNQVHDGDWEIVLPIIQKSIDIGMIVAIQEEVEEKEVILVKNAKPIKVELGKSKDFSALTTKEQKEILTDTNDPAALQEWLDNASKESVRLLILKRQDEIRKQVDAFESRPRK